VPGRKDTIAVIPYTFLRRINIFSLCGYSEDWSVFMGTATSDLLHKKKGIVTVKLNDVLLPQYLLRVTSSICNEACSLK